MAETRRPRALINGFGRIGRLALRRSLGFGGADLAAFDVVAVNDPLAVVWEFFLLSFLFDPALPLSLSLSLSLSFSFPAPHARH